MTTDRRITDEEIAAIETDANELADETRAKGGFNYLASTTCDLVAEIRSRRVRESALRSALARFDDIELNATLVEACYVVDADVFDGAVGAARVLLEDTVTGDEPEE